MESANSGSLQSSSGGDDEYDSRAADSVFITSNNNAAAAQLLEIDLQQLHQNSIPFSTNLPWPNPIGPHSIFPFAAAEGAAAAAQPIVQQSAARNPKKRSRASRRAPTTVLTTDTTNFRAMVQEFTGIPSPPFNTSSSFPRSRLDFFASRSAQPPPYLRRRPSATAINNHLPNLFNIPNQNQNQNNLTSLIQTSPKFPFSTSAKPQNSFDLIQNDDQFGVSLHNQGSETLPGLLPSLIPSDHSHIHSGGAAKWEIGGKISYEFERSEIGGKISTPENNIATRGEGMVESWICSSE